jgi:ketosteroid isomerase-like protein
MLIREDLSSSVSICGLPPLDTVALEADWTGTLRIAVGSIPEGGEMRMHFGVFLTFRDGKIAEQRNYDCFEPW